MQERSAVIEHALNEQHPSPHQIGSDFNRLSGSGQKTQGAVAEGGPPHPDDPVSTVTEDRSFLVAGQPQLRGGATSTYVADRSRRAVT